MLFKHYEKKDRQIAGFATILALTCALLLINDSWIYQVVSSDLDKLQKIGGVRSSKNDVRRRYKIAFSWIPLKSANIIYQGDSIFTGADSTAIIVTDGGEEITISPNSLVVINTLQDTISLDIGFGSIKGKVESGKTLLISSNDTVTEITGEGAEVNIDAGDGQKVVVNVLKGQVTSRSEDGIRKIGPGQASEIKPPEQVAPTPEPQKNIEVLSPIANQKVKPIEDETRFAWKVTGEKKNQRIQVSKDPFFQKIISSESTSVESFILKDLPKDVELYWRVVTEDLSSKATPFALVGENPPIPVTPKAGTHIYYDAQETAPQTGAEVDLQWEKGSIADRFQVEVAKDENFDLIIQNLTSQTIKTKTNTLPNGEYYWRVRSADFPNQEWSEISYFNVGDSPMKKISAPIARTSQRITIVTKRHGQTTQFIKSLLGDENYKYMYKIPVIKWAQVAQASSYYLEIASSINFEAPIVRETIIGNSYEWASAKPGKYFWRIQAQGPKYSEGVFSGARPLTIDMAPSQNMSLTLIEEKIPDLALLDTPPPPFNLKWNPTLFTESYELQFSDNDSFQNAKSFYTSNNNKSIQVRKPGKYFWKIRSVNREGIPISRYSNIYPIEFKRAYSDPDKMQNLKALRPGQMESIILVGSGENDIRFLWSNPFKNSNYRIQIAADPSFSKILVSELTKRNRFTFKGRLIDGLIYWRVRAENSIFTSSWTIANRFQVSYEGAPFDSELSNKLYQARLKARERQRILSEIIRLRNEKMRSPSATADIQLDTPNIFKIDNFLELKSNLEITQNWENFSKQPYHKFYKQHKKHPVFKWEPVSAAQRYVVEISRNPSFKNPLIKYPTTENFYKWESVRPGQFYWRVQAFNDNYVRSNFSPTQSLYVSAETPVSLSTDTFVEVLDEPPQLWFQPSPFQLEWTPVVFARAYQVEFSDSVTFENRKSFVTPKTNHKFRVSRTGTYFWRVRPINSNGVGVGPFSRIRAVEIAQAQRSPASVDQVTGLFPKGGRTLVFVGKGIMNLLFQWVSPPEENEDFLVEISSSPQFNEIIARETSKTNRLQLKNTLPDGNIYWRVGTRKGSVIQKWSESYKFFLKREQEAYSADNASR